MTAPPQVRFVLDPHECDVSDANPERPLIFHVDAPEDEYVPVGVLLCGRPCPDPVTWSEVHGTDEWPTLRELCMDCIVELMAARWRRHKQDQAEARCFD